MTIGKKTCSICDSKQPYEWCYTQDVNGDTTFETPFTKSILQRASQMVRQAAEDAQSRSLTLCLTRPPGHHSCSDKKRRGFCHVNFIMEALDFFHQKNLNCVIIDIDAHHGDGTEEQLLQRSYGYYTSIHGFGQGVYPGTGKNSSERVLNLPLDKHADSHTWLNAWSQQLLPFVNQWKPDIVLLSCGLDAHEKDTLAPLSITTECYTQIGKDLQALHIPVFGILEGGYCLSVLGESMRELVSAFV